MHAFHLLQASLLLLVHGYARRYSLAAFELTPGHQAGPVAGPRGRIVLHASQLTAVLWGSGCASLGYGPAPAGGSPEMHLCCLPVSRPLCCREWLQGLADTGLLALYPAEGHTSILCQSANCCAVVGFMAERLRCN